MGSYLLRKCSFDISHFFQNTRQGALHSNFFFCDSLCVDPESSISWLTINVTIARTKQGETWRCKMTRRAIVLFVGCLSSQQHASVSQGRICTDNFTCCHTEIEAADQTFHLTQSQYTDTGPTSPSADSITPGAWQGSHWSANF